MMGFAESDIHWLWISIALLFLLLELLASTGFFLGIVAAGFVMGGIDYALDLSWQQSVVSFAVLSTALSLVWLKIFKKDEENPTDAPTLNNPMMAMIGKQFQLQAKVDPGESSVMLGSAMHPVRLNASGSLAKGEWIQVDQVDGRVLVISKRS